MRPISRLIIAFVLAGLLCQLSYMIFIKEVKKYQVHNTERLTELLTRTTDFDMLFIGSSRTHFSINPMMIDNVCHTQSYNAGVEGGNLYEFEMMLRAYLENHPAPKWLVLTIDLHSFAEAPKMFNYPVYYPYLQNKTIKRYLEQNDHLSFLKQAVPFLRIMDYDDDTKGSFIKGLSGKSDIPDNDFQYKGYLSNTSNVIGADELLPARSTMKITGERKTCLDSVVNICKRDNIRLIFTYAPEYAKRYQQVVSNAGEILNYINDYAVKHGIPYLKDDGLDICTDPSMFANVGHLNKEGAKRYSVILGKELNGIINK